MYNQSCPKALPSILLKTIAIARQVLHTVPSLYIYSFLCCSLWLLIKTPQTWSVPLAFSFQTNVYYTSGIKHEKHNVSSEERIIPVFLGWEKAPVLIHVTLVSVRSNSIKAREIITAKSWRCSVVPHSAPVTICKTKRLRNCYQLYVPSKTQELL